MVCAKALGCETAVLEKTSSRAFGREERMWLGDGQGRKGLSAVSKGSDCILRALELL